MAHISTQGFYAYTDTLKGLYYGPGSVTTALPKLLQSLGAKRALIVTGSSLYHKTDVVKKVEAVLKEHNAYGTTFHDIGQHSPIAGIRKGVQAFKDSGADIIVAIGGGSPIDASKAILHFLQQDNGGPCYRQIAIPTTLSAAEFTTLAGYLNQQGDKAIIVNPQLSPAGIILDAELTLATPEKLWLSTGIRALDHAVETLYRPIIVPPPIKYLCYAAIADLFRYLPQCKANPTAVDIRQKLQIASWMSLWPLKVEKDGPLGLSHALGHKLGGTYSIPHGITSCLTLAPVVALQTEIASDSDKEWLAGALFHLREPSTGSIDGDILQLSFNINKLVAGLGLSSCLEEYKVPRIDIPKIAERALGSKDSPLFPKIIGLIEGIYSAGN